MIELFEQNIRRNDRQSSKGNQLKWEDRGIWYKADYTGYEGLAEYVVSHLLLESSLSPNEYVLYDQEQIKYRRKVFQGVCSDDFLTDDWQIITLERLFRNFYNRSLYECIWSIPDVTDRLIFLVSQTERITGLRNFGKYLNKIFTIDAFFLNEDRHTHNIAVLMNQQNKFRFCPIFDHGACLLSDETQDYPLEEDTYQLIEEVTGKTISSNFDEQLDLSEELYGNQLRFTFTRKNVEELLNQVTGYSPKEIERVRTILYRHMNKYQYLFLK